MKKQRNFMQKIGALMVSLLAASVLFYSCKKSDPVHIPAAGLMVFNLMPDQDAIQVTADNNPLFNVPLGYFSFSGNYLPLNPGSRVLRSYAYEGSTPLTSTTASLADSGYYSLFVLGVEDSYQSVLAEDKLQNLPATTGNAFIRYVNAITGDDDHNISINSTSGEVFNDINKSGHISDFEEVAPGDVDIAVSNAGVTDVTRTITLEKNGIYTVLISGIPESTDETTAIQIKFIQNGEIAPE